jgi:Malectin domain
MSFDLTSTRRYVSTKFVSWTETPVIDLAINGSSLNEVTSAFHPFTSASVGGRVLVLSNTGITPAGVGWFAGGWSIASVTGGVATLTPLTGNPYTNPGTASVTGGFAIIVEELADLSPYFVSADTTHTDEIKAHQGTFVIANPKGLFDKYAGVVTLQEGQLVSYQKSYSASPGGTPTVYDQFYGRVTRANPHYQRFAPTGEVMNGQGELIEVACVDLLKNTVRQNITSDPYYNTQLNNIASDILLRYSNIVATNLYNEDRTLEFYQALDENVIDILSILYDLTLEFAWCNYSGIIETYPRLGAGGAVTAVSPAVDGSGYTYANVTVSGGGGTGATVTANIVGGAITSYTVTDDGDGYVTEPTITVFGNGSGATATATIGGTGLVGYPDATSPPSATPDFTFADASLIIAIDEVWQDFELINQIRVLGQALADTTSLGAYQMLTNLGDENNRGGFIASGGGTTVQMPFSPTGNNANIQTAQNVYVKFFTVSLANFGAPSQSGASIEPNYAYMVWGGPGTAFTTNPICSDDPSSPFFGKPLPFGPSGTILSEPWTFPGTSTPVPWERPNGCTAPQAGLVWINGDGEIEGGCAIQGQSQQALTIGLNATDQGGFGFRVEVWGQPIIVQQATLEKYLDYNVQYVNANGSDVFGDHTTYQLPNSPVAMGTPFEVAVNPSTLLSTTLYASTNIGDGLTTPIQLNSITNLIVGQTIRLGSQSTANAEYPIVQDIAGSSPPYLITLSEDMVYQHTKGDVVIGLGGFMPSASQPITGIPYYGVISADGVYQSDGFQVDFERGRIVFTNRQFVPFAADSMFSGGTTQAKATNFDLSYVTPLGSAAPLAVYQTQRIAVSAGQYFTYTLPALSLGVGYTVRCHMVDYTFGTSGQRVFNIFANGLEVATGVDIVASTGGGNRAYVLDITGVAADSSGNIEIQFGGSGWGVTDIHNGVDRAVLCGLELFLPDGGVGDAYSINTGNGPAITPTPPTVTANYGVSAIQQKYGIQSFELDDPLLKTVGECTVTGQYFLNQSAWARNPFTIRTMSVPTLKPAQMIKIFNPRVGANGSDMWHYIQAIKRHTERPMPDSSGSVIEGEYDYDEFSTYLLYVQAR